MKTTLLALFLVLSVNAVAEGRPSCSPTKACPESLECTGYYPPELDHNNNAVLGEIMGLCVAPLVQTEVKTAEEFLKLFDN